MITGGTLTSTRIGSDLSYAILALGFTVFGDCYLLGIMGVALLCVGGGLSEFPLYESEGS